ncbi:hypothetical protein [Vibrio scophthalmi]|uniref:Uncharacterized protein n=1 Tax=Vibrio scophthalmi TaxID=45658 RepID=A0A1E3WPL0_9VIBR|nr:hypothetical protein [Vibrio scophthalmi]ODS10932.1 hypothetical protein VSF3289_01193 [Vibrio scophthalmi]
MSKKPNNQGEHNSSIDQRKIQNEKFNEDRQVEIHHRLPTGGQKNNIEIMQRTATPPNPNGGNTPTKK